MAASEAIESPAQSSFAGFKAALLRHWPLLIGFLVLAIPTFIGLADEVWTLEIGAHGPIVLATGLWLVSQRLNDLRESSTGPSWGMAALGMAISIPLYIFGRAYDFISLEALAVYGAMLAIMCRIYGFTALLKHFFPFLYLGFLVPPPGWLIDQATAPLRSFVSMVSTEMLQMFGYPIAREGITMYIAQYQLLVEDACSGMNSIIGLTAITLFYIYVIHRASWRYSLLLMAFILPIAIVTNILRVVALVLITYYFGNATAQGFMHMTTGVMLFAVALVLVFGLDALLQRLFHIGQEKPAS